MGGSLSYFDNLLLKVSLVQEATTDQKLEISNSLSMQASQVKFL